MAVLYLIFEPVGKKKCFPPWETLISEKPIDWIGNYSHRIGQVK